MNKRKKPHAKKDSYHNLAITILQESNEPMHVKDILKEILKKKKVEGKTPENTLSSILQRSELFQKVDKNKYVLKPI